MNNVICIINYPLTNKSKDTGHFLRLHKNGNKVTDISEDNPKSLVLLEGGTVVISPISAYTLLKRSRTQGALAYLPLL